MQNSYFQENPLPLHLGFLIFGFFHNYLIVQIESLNQQETIEKRRSTSFVKIIWVCYKQIQKLVPPKISRCVFPVFFATLLILMFQINQHPFAALGGSAIYELFYYLKTLKK